jgi:hypothetical protein
VSRACRGTPRSCGHRINLPFLISVIGLQFLDQAFGGLGNVRGEAGRGEVETENYAHRGVPYSQSRVPAQEEYHHAEQQRQRYRYRQSITPFSTREAAVVFVSPIQSGIRCGSDAAAVRFQAGSRTVAVRFATTGRPSRPLVVAECAVRLAARPPGTRDAFHASRPAVPRQCAAGAPDAGPASCESVLHDLITSPLLLMLCR